MGETRNEDLFESVKLSTSNFSIRPRSIGNIPYCYLKGVESRVRDAAAMLTFSLYQLNIYTYSYALELGTEIELNTNSNT